MASRTVVSRTGVSHMVSNGVLVRRSRTGMSGRRNMSRGSALTSRSELSELVICRINESIRINRGF